MTDRSAVPRILFVVLVTTLTGCDLISDPGEVICPAVAEPAIAVTALHAETDEPIGDVLVVIREGSYADTAMTGVSSDGDPLAARLGLERPGTYDVSARKEGFSPWSRSDVVVPEGECGPETVEITARLTPGA